ncbi:DUF3240 family protein [Nitrospirillum sp. BR 11163]|uniref:DUF3240 family protein n=1 Tax=Nitrospirillum sp. BR 11163 TaxID=3104323 RepID=UPI002AFFA064|nr:DUF3240 family protein [Nitrospirillum sp. BR 11163]MEA1674687.1 DUF3240 family protein [Nitrospirillum sp. BR 11163]
MTSPSCPSASPEAVHILLIECYAEFEADMVDVLLDAGGLVDRFSISPVRLYGRDLPLPTPRDRVVGSRPGLRAVVEVRGDVQVVAGRLRHHLGRAGLSIQAVQGHPLVVAGPGPMGA